MNSPPKTGADAVVVMTTTASEEEARTIADALLQRRLAACINLLPGMRSCYRWEGRTRDDEEVLLLIKTTRRRFAEVRAAIRELHSYELPEILALPVEQGDTGFLAWLSAAVEPDSGDDRSG